MSMPELPASPPEPSRFLDLVGAYIQPRVDEYAFVAAALAGPLAVDESLPLVDTAPEKPMPKQPVKSRRRHGSPNARRKTRTATPGSPATKAA